MCFCLTSVGYAQVGTYRITNPQRLFWDMLGSLAWTSSPSWTFSNKHQMAFNSLFNKDILHSVISNKTTNTLTDIWPASRGQSTASSACTSSSGISWLTVSMFPERMAWRWGSMPEQWLPERPKRIKDCLNIFWGDVTSWKISLQFWKTRNQESCKTHNLALEDKWICCDTWDDLESTILLQWVIKSEPYREDRTTSDTPIPAVNTVTVRHHKINHTDLNHEFQDSDLPHILMPGHIWKFTLPISSLLGIRFEYRVFTDEARVQQDHIWTQDCFDHL